MSGPLAYEWRRARSVRTTWVTALATIASVGVLAWLVTSATSELERATVGEVMLAALVGNPLVIVLVSSLGAMAFGHEYRYQTIRSTLSLFPRRRAVFLAKLVLTVAVVLIVTALALACGYAVALVAGGPGGGEVDWWSAGWQSVVYTTALALVAFGLTVVTRSHPLGIVGPLLLTVLEAVLIAVAGQRFTWLPDVLPFTALSSWLSGVDAGMSAVVLGLWVVGVLGAGLLLFARRDA